MPPKNVDHLLVMTDQWAHSEPDPFAAACAPSDSTPARSTGRPVGSKARTGSGACPGVPCLGKILLVDDEEKLTFVLSAHLHACGYEVSVAHDGAEGLALASSFEPDVIVMDIGMPVMDGVEATRRLKQNPETEHIPVILLTGKARTEDLVIGLEAGAQEYVAKPFEVAELLARIRTMIRLAGTRRELDHVNNELAGQVAVKTRQLQLLYEYARALNEATDCATVYNLVVDTVRELTGSKRISLMLKDGDDDEHLRCVKAVGIDPAIVGQIRVQAMHGIAGQVFTSGKTFVARAYGEAADRELAKRYATEAFLSTPLISTSLATHDETIGVLNVTDREDGQPFSQNEIDCIRSTADSAAIAIRNLQQRQRLSESVKVLLLTVGHLAEYRDEETSQHLERVARYARLLAEELGRSPEYAKIVSAGFIEDIHLVAPLHDIGKVGIPDDILTKPGALTDQEFRIMKTHTEIGRRTLEFALAKVGQVPMLRMCVDIAYCHHEKYDGRGYPRGISGEEIPLTARIIALADAYDAITSHRRYAPARPHEQAVEIIESEAGQHFDPAIVAAFLRCSDRFQAVRGTEATAPDEPVSIPVPAPAPA
ncbi:MAG: response regulator [Planctomycetes bacterium]|nr:response regulator [Planctomycetota bacterium]